MTECEGSTDDLSAGMEAEAAASAPAAGAAPGAEGGGGGGVGGGGGGVEQEHFMMTREQMLKQGAPADYHEALVDVGYMDMLIRATERHQTRRREKLDRFVIFNRIIFGFLCLQTFLGLWLAFYGTLLVPNYEFSALLELEDIDVVFVLDTSNRRAEELDSQKSAVEHLTASLFKDVDEARKAEVEAAQLRLQAAKKESLTGLRKVFKNEELSSSEGGIIKYGGWLRVAVGTFNADARPLHSLTYDEEKHQTSMKLLTSNQYSGDAHWQAAFSFCQKTFSEAESVARGTLTAAEDFRRAERCYTRRLKDDPPCSDFDDDRTSLRDCPGRYCSLVTAAAQDGGESDDEETKPGPQQKQRCVERSPHCRKQLCVVLGDSNGMCKKRTTGTAAWADKIAKACATNSKLCPSEEEKHKQGNPVEWLGDFAECADSVLEMNPDAEAVSTDVDKLNDHDNVELLMMLTAPTSEEQQVRLENRHFREFAAKALKCHILAQPTPDEADPTHFHDNYILDRSNDGCSQLMMMPMSEGGLDSLVQDASASLKESAKFSDNSGSQPRRIRDNRWAIFLIWALNFPCFFGWVCAIRWYMSYQKQKARTTGETKKMVKVTKSLVEKAVTNLDVTAGGASSSSAAASASASAAARSGASTIAVASGEVEMAMVERAKSVVELGTDLTLRCRLKGGFLRTNRQKADADGNGQAFDRVSAWSFEPVSETFLPPGQCGDEEVEGPLSGNTLRAGQQVYVRNFQGHFLCALESGTRLVEDPSECEDSAAQFVVSLTGDTELAHYGEVLRFQSLKTHYFLGCNKDGHVDCLKEGSSPEAQFVVDAGGQPITSGALVTLHNDSSFAYLNSDPQGQCGMGEYASLKFYQEHDWHTWMIERVSSVEAVKSRMSLATESETRARATAGSISAIDILITRGALKEGDIVRLKGLNQRYLQANRKGDVTCAEDCGNDGDDDNDEDEKKVAVAQQSSKSSSSTSEFVIHRIGLPSITKFNNAIRRGVKISLKPVHEDDEDLSFSHSNTYLRVKDGCLSATGSLTNKEISFTIDIDPVQNVVAPLTSLLERGDAELLFRPAPAPEATSAAAPAEASSDGEKTAPAAAGAAAGAAEAAAGAAVSAAAPPQDPLAAEAVRKCPAATGAWLETEDLSSFCGELVAFDAGTFPVPSGVESWTAVVKEGDADADVYKVAEAAKQLGAGAMVLMAEEVCSQDRFALGADGISIPALPMVFVSLAAGKELLATKVVLVGGEIKRRYMTVLMRAIGQLRGPDGFAEVFSAAGSAMVERWKEKTALHEHAAKAAKEEEERLLRIQEEELSSQVQGQGRFKWKVTTNTNYYWAKSGGGGATFMKVDHGTYAAAAVRFKTEGSWTTGPTTKKQIVTSEITKLPTKSPSRLSVTCVSAEDLRNMRLADRLLNIGESLDETELEQLGEESDFKIEYTFEEVEVGVEEKPDEAEDEAVFEDSGRIMRLIAVPRRSFYVALGGLVVSTLLSLIIVIVVMLSGSAPSFEDGRPDDLPAYSGAAATGLAAAATAGLTVFKPDAGTVAAAVAATSLVATSRFLPLSLSGGSSGIDTQADADAGREAASGLKPSWRPLYY